MMEERLEEHHPNNDGALETCQGHVGKSYLPEEIRETAHKQIKGIHLFNSNRVERRRVGGSQERFRREQKHDQKDDVTL